MIELLQQIAAPSGLIELVGHMGIEIAIGTF